MGLDAPTPENDGHISEHQAQRDLGLHADNSAQETGREMDSCARRESADAGEETEVGIPMSVQVYGCNHVAIEVDDVEKAVEFYQDVFNLQKLDEGEGDAFFKLGEHQFLAIFKVEEVMPDRMRHFGIMVRDEGQLAEVREKITRKYG